MRVRVVVLVVAGLMLALAGCSSDGSDNANPEAQALVSIPPGDTDAALPGEASPGPVASAEPQEVEEPGTIGANELPTVNVGEEVDLDGGVGVTVISVSDVQIDAQGPGEVSGPGEAVEIEITNNTREPLDLGGVAVLISYGDQPGIASFSAPDQPLSGDLAPGGRATGIYAFLKPAGASGKPVVRVEHNSSQDVALVVQ